MSRDSGRVIATYSFLYDMSTTQSDDVELCLHCPLCCMSQHTEEEKRGKRPFTKSIPTRIFLQQGLDTTHSKNHTVKYPSAGGRVYTVNSFIWLQRSLPSNTVSPSSWRSPEECPLDSRLCCPPQLRYRFPAQEDRDCIPPTRLRCRPVFTGQHCSYY